MKSSLSAHTLCVILTPFAVLPHTVYRAGGRAVWVFARQHQRSVITAPYFFAGLQLFVRLHPRHIGSVIGLPATYSGAGWGFMYRGVEPCNWPTNHDLVGWDTRPYGTPRTRRSRRGETPLCRKVDRTAPRESRGIGQTSSRRSRPAASASSR